MAHNGALFHHRTLEQNTVFHIGALFHLHAAEHHAALHTALNVAAVGDEGIHAYAGRVDVSGRRAVLLGINRPSGAEQLLAQRRLQHLHTALIVALNGVDMGRIAVPHIGVEIQLLHLVLQHMMLEAVAVVRHALVHQAQQQLGLHHEQVQTAVAGGDKQIIGRINDAAVIVQLEIDVLAAAQGGRTNGGDIRFCGDMALQHILQRQVDDHIAVGQHRILLPDAAQVIAHAAKSLHLAPELAAVLPMLGIGEGRQQRQAAVIAAQVPAFAAAQMVKQTLALAVHDNAHIAHTGVDHIAEHEVHHTVVPGKRQRAVDPVLDQFAQAGFFLIGKDDAVHGVHAFTSR